MRIISAQALLEEPRIDAVNAVDIESDPDNRNAVNITFSITPAGTSTPLNLVYPFYTEVATV